MRGSWTFVERWVIFRIAEQSGLYTAPSVHAVRLQRFGSRASVVLFTAQNTPATAARVTARRRRLSLCDVGGVPGARGCLDARSGRWPAGVCSSEAAGA